MAHLSWTRGRSSLPARCAWCCGAEPTPQENPFWATLRAIWDSQAARGQVPRSAEDIEAERRALREGMDQEIDEAVRLQGESRRLREQANRAAQEGE